jgi:hypothetical protein
MPTETVNVSVIEEAGGVARTATNVLALLGETTDSTKAGVVKKFRRVSDAEDYYSDGSGNSVSDELQNAVADTLGSGLPSVYTVAYDVTNYAPSYNNQSGALTDDGSVDDSDLPIKRVNSVSVDGTTIANGSTGTITYTHSTPSESDWEGDNLAGGDNEIVINPETGDYEISDTGTSFTIDFDTPDLDDPLSVLDREAYEYHTLAGLTYNDQYHGMFDEMLTHATDENKLVTAALDSGVAPADVKDLVELKRDGRMFLVAAYYNGDLTSAIGAHRAQAQVSATAKERPAPTSISFTGSYTDVEYGTEENPGSSTFHGMGVNAIEKDAGGTYRLTNDRAMTGLTAFDRFHSTKRAVRYVQSRIEDDILSARRDSGTNLPYTAAGITAVRNVIRGSLGYLERQGIIDPEFTQINMPRLSEVNGDDRQNRVLPGIEVDVRLTGQIHLVKLDLRVDL